jgi:DNA-binding Lrp family transcriptional regulator
MLTPIHKQLLNDYQQDFPLSSQPFLEIAEQLGVSEEFIIEAFSLLQEQSLVSRIGPIIQPNNIGISSLIAMIVPSKQLESCANIINQFSEVNHNYERDHQFNLWFVIIASDPNNLTALLSSIEQKTRLSTFKFPLLEDYFINLGFQLDLND